MDRTPRIRIAATVALLILTVSSGGHSAAANEPPVAEAGLPRYAAQDPVRLDGSASYDPDHSGPLTYAWRQTSGPVVIMADANSATPLISGPSQTGARGQTTSPRFVQTNTIQECEFELVVSDGELTSRPDTVRVVIVPSYGASTLQLENPPFDPNKPTFIYFGGGDCVNGSGTWGDAGWASKANVISFSPYSPDSGGATRTYYKYGDMTIVYFSSVAPDYRQLIQTAGWSTGGQPAIDVGLRLNLTYKDARYAVNRVTFLDATPYCRDYTEAISRFLASSVDGEQCWIDNNVGQNVRLFFPGVLNVASALSHSGVPNWVSASSTDSTANTFNHGLVAGAYWSVIGPGKNLQLAPTPDKQIYTLKWVSSVSPNYMDFYDESSFPGRLPEPVTLGAWVNRSGVSGDIDGAVLTCDQSENAVGYQLLFGSDPHRVAHYKVISDTPLPPMGLVRDLPSGETWWTIRVRDQYGSTIYADPVRLDLMSVANARTGKRYALIQHAIRDAQPGDVILLDPATHEENIEFRGGPVTLQSLDANNTAAVAGTVLRGRGGSPTVTFSGPESRGCVLAGLTIQSGTIGVSCRNAVPTIRNCVVKCPDGTAVEFWWDCKPNLLGCTLLGRVKEGGDDGLVAYWKLDEAEGAIAHDSAGRYDANVMGDPIWQPAGGRLAGALRFDGMDSHVRTPFVRSPSLGAVSVFAWVKGGAPGQVLLSQENGANWLMAGTPDGALKTDLKPAGRQAKSLTSTTVITNDAWHRVGLVSDGSNRILYVDDIEVAKDAQANEPTVWDGMYLGAGSALAPGTFWSGLIDDVRIYDRAVKP